MRIYYKTYVFFETKLDQEGVSVNFQQEIEEREQIYNKTEINSCHCTCNKDFTTVHEKYPISDKKGLLRKN